MHRFKSYILQRIYSANVSISVKVFKKFPFPHVCCWPASLSRSIFNFLRVTTHSLPHPLILLPSMKWLPSNSSNPDSMLISNLIDSSLSNTLAKTQRHKERMQERMPCHTHHVALSHSLTLSKCSRRCSYHTLSSTSDS